MAQGDASLLPWQVLNTLKHRLNNLTSESEWLKRETSQRKESLVKITEEISRVEQVPPLHNPPGRVGLRRSREPTRAPASSLRHASPGSPLAPPS